jgi:hypothetical protein
MAGIALPNEPMPSRGRSRQPNALLLQHQFFSGMPDYKSFVLARFPRHHLP